MIETGKVLQSRYRIEKQIGQGGMGAVYVATDERFGSIVAIKETLFMDDNYRKAIEREARLLNSLKHTALPRVSDHFLEENGQFLVMEYIPGDDLFEMMESRREPFPLDDILRWADQLLDALEFLHTQDMPVIHRDIKPQNLKLTARGQIILLDFGLAKGNPTDAEHNTAAKSIFGYSRNYASLEQIQGTGTDPRSDLYSLAATLYHLVTAVPPEDALTRAMSVLSRQADPLLPANRINPEVPKGVAAVLQKALDLNAGERPESAAAMRQMLHECDKTIVPGEADTVVTPAFDKELLDQETRMMGGGATRQEGAWQTDVKTEVLPTSSSGETSVRRGIVDTGTHSGNYAPAGAGASGGKGGRRWIGAIAAVLLLLVGCSAALYVLKPSVFGGTATGENQPAVGSSNLPVNSNTAPADAATTVTVTAPDGNLITENRIGPASDKQPETAKGAKSSAAPKQKTGEDDPTVVDMDDDEIRTGDVVIKDDRIETPDRVIDENGVHPKFPQRPPIDPNFRPNISPEQMKNLTPAQRRKIRLMLQRLPKPPTAPQPRPEN
jgi:serine/threonine protein kinase